MHTARMWMASAVPGGAPGYDDDKQFGNFITHMPALASRRLRKHIDPPRKVKAGHKMGFDGSLARFPGLGEHF